MSSPAKSHSRTPPGPDLGEVARDLGSLALALYPDPVLRRRAAEVQSFDEGTLSRLGSLAQRMLEVMRQFRGVGLAAPQVGVSVRMFVMNATGNPEDDRVYINPRLSNPHGEEEREEGCLSLPEINSPVLRSLGLRLRARDLTGAEIDETAEGFVARIWQHETDHLDGILILDKMPASVRISHRKKLKELEEQWREAHPQIARPTKKRRFGRRN